jgi:hypothetical protein
MFIIHAERYFHGTSSHWQADRQVKCTLGQLTLSWIYLALGLMRSGPPHFSPEEFRSTTAIDVFGRTYVYRVFLIYI